MVIQNQNKFNLAPRLVPRHPLTPAVSDYQGHSPDESAKFCLKCRTKQRRKFSVFGPMEGRLCGDLPVKLPRVTGHPIWKYLFYISYFVSPPYPPDQNRWYRVRVKAECPKCGEFHNEKDYRRQFGRLKRWELFLRSKISSSFEFVVIR
ncbi:MAG: hypothetical protein AAB470_02850 [Patescibacteria group bacterium]